ncbi:peptidylprolyl isomerase [Flavisericum labens]|uniref:peptidylprolyl isomerase n=1 Tax=Flavisericum labens TaxID=3377112 RepID=UPI00387B2104
MKKMLLIPFSLLITLISAAQTSTEEDLASIETPEQIEHFLEAKDSKKNKLVTFNEEKHKTKLTKSLFKLGLGGTKTNENEFDKTYYKVVDKTSKTYYRAAYIFLDGNKYDAVNIKALRERIIKKYRNGASFDFLARQYSMDSNAKKGGDLGWFTNGDMHADFEKEIINGDHQINDIFTIDIPSKKWYYVVLKTHEPKAISEIEVLKIVEPKD